MAKYNSIKKGEETDFARYQEQCSKKSRHLAAILEYVKTARHHDIKTSRHHDQMAAITHPPFILPPQSNDVAGRLKKSRVG